MSNHSTGEATYEPDSRSQAEDLVERHRTLIDSFRTRLEDPHDPIDRTTVLDGLTQLMFQEATKELRGMATPAARQARAAATAKARQRCPSEVISTFVGLGVLGGMLVVLLLALVVEVQMQHLGCQERLGALVGASAGVGTLVYVILARYVKFDVGVTRGRRVEG